jgi:hypothetical protein
MKLGLRTCSIGVAVLALSGCIPAHEKWHVTATTNVRVGEPTKVGFELLSVARDRAIRIRLESGEIIAVKPGDTFGPTRLGSPRVLGASYRKQQATLKWIVH